MQRLLLSLFVFIVIGCETFSTLPDEYSLQSTDLVYDLDEQFHSGILEAPASNNPEACYNFDGITCCVWEYETPIGARCAEEWCNIRDQSPAWIYSGSHCD